MMIPLAQSQRLWWSISLNFCEVRSAMELHDIQHDRLPKLPSKESMVINEPSVVVLLNAVI